MQFDLLDTVHNEILASKTYEEFATKLKNSNCKRCPLSNSRQNIVVDRGNPNARLMIISERPGENEDKKGIAFVGRAGELLDKIFAAIGLDTNRDMLICNLVKCLPPVERPPHVEEVRACLPYLEKQMELVRPRFIVLLGLVSAKFMYEECEEEKMEDMVGSFFTIPKYPGIDFTVLYHPAFLLRDPSKKRKMWEDVKRLKSALDELGIKGEVQG